MQASLESVDSRLVRIMLSAFVLLFSAALISYLLIPQIKAFNQGALNHNV
jgi:hypothetical protein